MADVTVPFGENATETAILLLAAAEESKDHDAYAVRTAEGAFVVPEKLAKSAGVDYEGADDNGDEDGGDEAPAKKTASKRATKK